MNISKRTVIAIILNLILPGVGYLYTGVKARWPLAIFLIFITVYEIVHTIIGLSHGNTDMSAINLSPLFPGLVIAPLGIMLAAVMSVDTYFLTKKEPVLRSKSRNS